MKSLKTIINESTSSKSDISTFVSVLKDMFSWDSLDSKGKEIVRDMFSDSDSRGTIQPQLLAFAGSTYQWKDNKDAYKNGRRIMKAIYDELDD